MENSVTPNVTSDVTPNVTVNLNTAVCLSELLQLLQ